MLVLIEVSYVKIVLDVPGVILPDSVLCVQEKLVGNIPKLFVATESIPKVSLVRESDLVYPDTDSANIEYKTLYEAKEKESDRYFTRAYAAEEKLRKLQEALDKPTKEAKQ